MVLHRTQSIVANDLHRFRIVDAGRRWGKTELSVEEMKGFAVARENGSVGYIAPTYQQARDIAWEKLKSSCSPMLEEKPNESRLEIIIRNQFYNSKRQETITNSGILVPWLSRIILRGWESVENFRGQAFDFLVPDEVAMYRNFWIGWHEVLRPTLTDRKGHALFISTPKGFNHFYDLYNFELKDTNYKSFHFTTYDNPFIPVEEIEQARNEIAPERFAQEYMADFTKTEGLVFKEFSREKHLFKDHQSNYIDVISGIDFGFTNPCAIYSIGIDSSDNMWIYDEYYKTRKTDTEVADYVASKNYNAVYPDPEAPNAIEELERRGVNVRDVIKGKDSIKNGIDKIRERLKAGKLHIHNSCVNLINEFETYSYPDESDKRANDEKPLDEFNHGIDAIRYAIMMYHNDSSYQPITSVYRDYSI